MVEFAWAQSGVMVVLGLRCPVHGVVRSYEVGCRAFTEVPFHAVPFRPGECDLELVPIAPEATGPRSDRREPINREDSRG